MNEAHQTVSAAVVRDPFGFSCKQCGACCRVPGYVALTPEEVDTIAKFLDMDVYTFTAQYTRLTADRNTLSLTETVEGACVFLTEMGCRIHSVKPAQCRAYPYTWQSREILARCPGWL